MRDGGNTDEGRTGEGMYHFKWELRTVRFSTYAQPRIVWGKVRDLGFCLAHRFTASCAAIGTETTLVRRDHRSLPWHIPQSIRGESGRIEPVRCQLVDVPGPQAAEKPYLVIHPDNGKKKNIG